MSVRRWSVNNRPDPKLVGFVTNGLLVIAALTGAAAGLVILEIGTRKWPSASGGGGVR